MTGQRIKSLTLGNMDILKHFISKISSFSCIKLVASMLFFLLIRYLSASVARTPDTKSALSASLRSKSAFKQGPKPSYELASEPASKSALITFESA